MHQKITTQTKQYLTKILTKYILVKKTGDSMQTNFDELSLTLNKIFEEKILKIIFSNCTKESKYKKNRN